jgi:Cu/Zn superoxide dismutase
MTLNAAGPVSSLPSGSRFVIRLGETGSGDGGNGGAPGQAAEAIAQSSRLADRPFGSGYGLSAVDRTTTGQSAGQLTGQATIIFDADMRTLTVTLNATGLTPGAHAAHIHSGSCQSQGAVLYMLMDFQADSHGDVVNQTRTITGVNAMPANGTWYLNVHMGDSNTIVANGGPTLAFRPLLCANG